MEQHSNDESQHKNNPTGIKKPGKGPITALVIVIILAIIAVGGTWYYMNNNAKNDKKAQDEQIQKLQKQVDELKNQSAAMAPAQTKSYTTKYDKLKFNYPSNWTLNDTSQAATADRIKDTGLVGLDVVTLKSPNGFEIEIKDGMYGIGGSCEPFSAQVTEKVNVLGKDLFINYLTNKNTSSPVKITVSSQPGDCIGGIDSKNLIVNTGQPTAIIISAGFDKNSTVTYDQLKSDPNLQAYKNFLQSLSY